MVAARHRGDWRALQAMGYILYRCGLQDLARRAWSAGLHVYLVQGGIPVYAQEPTAFPWWQLWDTEMQLPRPPLRALAELWMRGAEWTPNLWDRSVRSSVLIERLRQYRMFREMLRIRTFERRLAREMAPYRVAPLQWRAWRYVLRVGLHVWWPVAVTGILMIAVCAPFRHGPGIRWWIGSLLLAGVVGFGGAVADAWLASAERAWQQLHTTVLKDGNVRPPLRVRAEGNAPVRAYNRALRLRDTERMQQLTHRYPFLLGVWMRYAPDRYIPNVPIWPELHRIAAAARWSVIIRAAVQRSWASLREGLLWWVGWLPFVVLLSVLDRWTSPRRPVCRTARMARWLLIFWPGGSRARRHAFRTALILWWLTWLTTVLVVHIMRQSVHTIWGDQLSPVWQTLIVHTGESSVILWGGLYPALLGGALFCWTLHGMFFWMDYAAESATVAREPATISGGIHGGGGRIRTAE